MVSIARWIWRRQSWDFQHIVSSRHFCADGLHGATPASPVGLSVPPRASGKPACRWHASHCPEPGSLSVCLTQLWDPVALLLESSFPRLLWWGDIAHILNMSMEFSELQGKRYKNLTVHGQHESPWSDVLLKRESDLSFSQHKLEGRGWSQALSPPLHTSLRPPHAAFTGSLRALSLWPSCSPFCVFQSFLDRCHPWVCFWWGTSSTSSWQCELL